MEYSRVKMNEKWIYVTPDVAKELLKGNTCNRPIDQRAVSQYASDMKNGRWDVASVGVFLFFFKGVLKDGQHRLLAIIASGCSMWMKLVDPEEIPHVFDIQKKRSINDLAVLSGLPAESAEKEARKYARWFMTNAYGKESRRVTEMEAIEYASKHMDELVKANRITDLAKCKNLKNGRGHFIKSAIYCALRCGVTEDVLVSFVKCYSTGLYSNDGMTAAIVFRNMLFEGSQAKTDGRSDYRLLMFRVAQEAIKWFSEGKPRKIRFNGDFIEFSEKVAKEDGIVSVKHSVKNNPVSTEKKEPVDPTPRPKKFVPPTIDEVIEYIKSIGSKVDPYAFYDYYESNGWKVGKNPMKDWKAAVRYWERRSF